MTSLISGNPMIEPGVQSEPSRLCLTTKLQSTSQVPSRTLAVPPAAPPEHNSRYQALAAIPHFIVSNKVKAIILLLRLYPCNTRTMLEFPSLRCVIDDSSRADPLQPHPSFTVISDFVVADAPAPAPT